MLFKGTVDPSTLELLIQIQQKPWLNGFYLVGGIALALKMGHRTSVDIDLFSNFNFDELQMTENLSADFPFNLFFVSHDIVVGKAKSSRVLGIKNLTFFIQP